MTKIIYQLRGLKKAYNGREVLCVDHLDIHRGEVLAIVGPSGAGKSTLLRLLNFLEPPTSGHVDFLGTKFDSKGAMPLTLRRRVTTVFQRPVLLNQSVYANVSYGLRLRGHGKQEHLTNEALERVGLSSLATQRARTLSGGEAQRVALARAMVLRPDILLLDEPTANLDPYNVKLIEKNITSLNQELNTTLVMVTHNVFQARRLADRVCLILEGHTVEIAAKDAFFESPQDSRTFAFVKGEMVY